MIKRVVKCVAPGLATALGGTAIALLLAGAAIGAPAAIELAQAGSIVTLQPPHIADYWMSATRQPGGVVVFDGYVPDEATRSRLSTGENADTNYLKLGTGAPERYQSAIDFGLLLLQHLREGRFSLRGTTVTLSGTARSSADYDALTATIAEGAPQGVVLATSDIKAPAATDTPAKPKPADPVAPPKAKPQPSAPAVEPPAPPAAQPVPPVAQPATPAVDPAYTFSATRANDGTVTMSGQLPADPALRFFSVITGAPATGVTIAGGAPDGFILSAEAGLRALMELDNAQLHFANGKWSLSGKAADATAGTTLKSTIAALPSGAAWTLAITTPPALDACQADVAAFSARNAILFKSGAAAIATDSEPALDELATDLAKCPQADIDIEGYTDADGDDAQNLALSVARAEAVVNALIARNIAPERLYAIGYGESMPVADNDTSAGKRLNRRIVVKVLQHHVD